MGANEHSGGGDGAQVVPRPSFAAQRGYRTSDPDRTATRKREILAAAARVFARRGYHVATTDDIAAEMGVTKGVVYYYFRAKEDIFFEVINSAIDTAIARLGAIVAVPSDSADTLRRALAAHIDYNLNEAEDGYYAVLVARELKSLPEEKRARIIAGHRRYVRGFSAIIGIGMAEGRFVAGNPGVAAATLIAAANDVCFWFRRDGVLDREAVVEQVANQLLRGLLPA